MKNVFIFCPAASYTGGPTLAHQLCKSLIDLGINAKMWYNCHPIKRLYNDPVHNNYKPLNLPYVTKRPQDLSDNVIVLLESSTTYLWKYKRAKCYIWWMSVDNYFLTMGSIIDSYKKRLGIFKYSLQYGLDYENKHKEKYSVIVREDVTHLVQSEYARVFLRGRNITDDKIFFLGDYLEDELLDVKMTDIPEKQGNVILYNPKKGYDFTRRLIEETPQYQWIPLINMSKSQVRDNLLKSKLYIDFGNHPGKDRFPREAVMCGCCIITGKRGAANNDIDIPIPAKYKYKDKEESIPAIINAMQDIIDNYNGNYQNFLPYRESILKEKDTFYSQVKAVFSDCL